MILQHFITLIHKSSANYFALKHHLLMNNIRDCRIYGGKISNWISREWELLLILFERCFRTWGDFILSDGHVWGETPTLRQSFCSLLFSQKWNDGLLKKWWETFEVKNLIKGWQVDLGQAEVNETEARVSIPCRLNSETTPTRLSDKKEFPHFDNLGIFCCDVSIACSEIPADPEDEANPRR